MKNKLLKKLLLPFVLLIGSLMYGQTVTGVVSDNSGVLPGVSISVKGKSVGTQTDFDGKYSLKANNGDILIFRYLGYKTVEKTVTSKVVNVTLTQDSTQLDEIVVVGYGSSEKKEITSSVTKVSEKDFNQGVISAPSELLQGKVAGLSIYNKGGNPNDDAVIRLRGISTVGANSSPLIVIDGVIGASLNNVDPSDIQSMTVLKDGSAAAIYGARGSSGVIIVTTKQGKKGKTQISYNGQVSSASIANEVQNMSADEFIAAGGVNLQNKTNWLKEVTRTALTTINNVAIAGGNDNSSYRFSANFRDAEGILQKSGFNQFNTRANIKTALFDDKLKIDINTSYTQRDSEFGFNDALRYASLYNPTAPIYGNDSPYDFNSPQYGGYFETLGLFDSFNPVSIVNQNSNNGSRNEFTYSANFKYSLSDNILLNAMYSEQRTKYTNQQYYSTTSLYRGFASNPDVKGQASKQTGENRFKLFELFGEYSKDFTSRINFKFTGGYSWQEKTSQSYDMSVGGFPSEADTGLSFDNAVQFANTLFFASDRLNLSSNASPQERIIGFFGRFNLNFDEAVFLNASLRYEGASGFGQNQKWGLFPSVGLGVDLNKYLKLSNTDLFKVRLGYGLTGALPSTYGLSQNQYAVSDSGTNVALSVAGNPDLKWEEKGETNFGIEYNAGRLSSTLDIYSRKVSDFILEVPVDAAVYGVNRRVENVGDLTTNGLELSLNYDILKSNDLNYNSGIVFSTYKTILNKLDGTSTLRGNLGAPGQNDTAVILVKEGEEVGQIYGALWDGTITNGSQNFVDVNGDGTIQVNQEVGNAIDADGDGVVDGDLTKLGKGIPDFELGWSHTLRYKNWDVNAFFRGAFGHSLVNTFRVFYEPRVGSQGSYNLINTKYADPAIQNAKFSSLYVEKADFIKLDNLSVGYNFDIAEDNKFFKSVRLSLTGQNLFVITGYSGVDPEPSLTDRGSVDNGGVLGLNADPLVPGIDRRYNYFAARTFTLGLNINF